MTASRFRVLGGMAHGIALAAVLLGIAPAAEAAPVVRRANGATAADIQATVDQFRTDLGGANNGIGGSTTAGGAKSTGMACRRGPLRRIRSRRISST